MKKVLVLEDEPMNQALFELIFKPFEGHVEFIYQDNGDAGLACLAEQSAALPDLIITDNQMPIMTGIEFIQAIKNDERFSAIPVVMVTNNVANPDIISIQHHLMRLVEKDPSTPELRNVLRGLISQMEEVS